MIVEDQGEIIAFLSRPEAYGGAVSRVERMDTHISAIFLVGERAYKLKRAVRFPYLDFSTAARRRQACEAEVRLNRRTAPGLYLGVAAVTRGADGGLALAGPGRPVDAAVDWLVVMARFDQDTLFDRMAERGTLKESLMVDLAEAIARFHAEAEPRLDLGGKAGMSAVLESNAEAFAEAGPRAFDQGQAARLEAAMRAALERHGELLETRRADGLVCHCHGDLHLRNICLIDGRPTLFDAIEFSEAIACIDVFYDLAFLLMDLEHWDLRALASMVLNRYLELTGDFGGLAALPLFLSCRAAIRSHVSAAAAVGERMPEARAYLDMALDFLAPPPPRLIALGGLSGTGKSTLARGLAPTVGAAPGAVVVRSDVLRKELMGVDTFTKLGPKAYRAGVTRRVYETLYRRAALALEAGHAVIADAVFARRGQRDAIAAVAGELGVPFQGLWLEAPVEVMERRLASRGKDASDATVSILRRQLAYRPGSTGWTRVDASGGTQAIEAAALTLLDP